MSVLDEDRFIRPGDMDHSKLDRKCPRCHQRRYHFGNMIKSTKAVKITCAECGHSWRGRYKKDEWS